PPARTRSASASPPGWLRRGRTKNRAKNTADAPRASRSEEHTSELQSLAYLVCRLLLEKKKSVHGVLNPTYQAGLRRDAVHPDIEAERKKRDEIEAGKIYCSRRFGAPTRHSFPTRRSSDLRPHGHARRRPHHQDGSEEAERRTGRRTLRTPRGQADRKSTRLNSSH